MSDVQSLPDWQTGAALAIFIATYVVVALGKLPYLRLDRAGAALVGASLMVACGVLPVDAALAAIDGKTILLLLGVMIVVAYLRLSGVFRLAGAWIMPRAGHPLALLAVVVLMAGVGSAFLVNDTMCLVLTPLVVELALKLRRDPVPYCLAIALAANAGSVATITGNPQNMIVGSLSGIGYLDFAASLAPVAAMGLVAVFLAVVLFNPREFLVREHLRAVDLPAHHNPALATKSLLAAAAMVAAFLAGVPVEVAAIVAGSLLLLTRRVKANRIYAEIDWPLLMMFCGLFVVVAGLEAAVVSEQVVAWVVGAGLDVPWRLAAVTAVLSNLVSNVPAVLVMAPFVPALDDPDAAWRMIAMASTLAGNFTLLGSIANLIVAEKASRYGVKVGFARYFVVGAPLTVVTIGMGVLWLGAGAR